MAWPGVDPRRAFGLAAVAGGAAICAANLWLPWLLLAAEGSSRPVFRPELMAHPIPYEQLLLWAPLAAAGLAVAAGGVLALPARHPFLASMQPAALGGVALAGFLLLLCGTRWVGFAAARLMERGPSPVRLPALPYLDLGVGALLAGCALALARPPRLPHPAQKVGVTAAALLALLPLAPLAVGSDGFHYDELSLEQVRVLGTGGTPADALLVLRWTLVALLAAGCAAGWPLLRLPPALKAFRTATFLGGTAALLAAGSFYLDLGSLQTGARPWPNPPLPLAGPLLLGLGAWPRLWKGVR